MTYLLNTPEEKRQMLDAIGVSSMDELFDPVPAELRLNRPLALPQPLTEIELVLEPSSGALGGAYIRDARPADWVSM